MLLRIIGCSFISVSHSSIPFELLHVGFWGLYKTLALICSSYLFTVVDDCTKTTWTYILHNKTLVVSINFIHYVQNHFHLCLKILRSNNGTEIFNSTCPNLLTSFGIIHQRSIPHTPQQNDIVERQHRHLLDTARSLKLHANFPYCFWGDYILTTIYFMN